MGVKCSHQRGCSHQQQLQLWANAEIKTLEMGQYTYYKLLFLATAGRTTWQAGFCLEIQVKDPKPCLKWNLKGEWTVEQREVGIPLAHLFGNLLHQELTSDPVCRQTQQTPLHGAILQDGSLTPSAPLQILSASCEVGKQGVRDLRKSPVQPSMFQSWDSFGGRRIAQGFI